MSRTFWLALLGLLLPGYVLIYGTIVSQTGVVVAFIGPFFILGMSAFNLAPTVALAPYGYLTRIGLTFWDPTLLFNPQSFSSSDVQQTLNIQSILLVFSGNPSPTSFTLHMTGILIIISIILTIIGLILAYSSNKTPMNTVFQIYISFFTFIIFVLAAAAQLASMNIVSGVISGFPSAQFPVAFTIPLGIIFLLAAAITSLYEPHVPQSGKIRWFAHLLLIGVVLHLSYGLAYFESGNIMQIITMNLNYTQVYQVYDLLLGIVGIPMVYSLYNLKVWGRIYGILALGFNTLVNIILTFLYLLFQFPLISQFGYYDNNFIFEILSLFLGQFTQGFFTTSDLTLSLIVAFATIFLPTAYFIVYIFRNKIMFVHR